jgi:hypothetical protein
MDAWLTEKQDGCKETIARQEVMEANPEKLKACHEVTKADMEKIEPNPAMIHPAGEHQEVPKEDAAVMLIRGLRRQCRDWNLASGCHQKQKGRIQASCEFQKRLTIDGRKVSCRARVAWCKRGIVRKDCTMAKVEQASQRVGPSRKNLWKDRTRKQVE